MKKNNTPKLSNKEKNIIENIGKLKFAKLHINFYNKMCRECKIKTLLRVKRGAKMQLDKLCNDCQSTYAGMARRYIKSKT